MSDYHNSPTSYLHERPVLSPFQNRILLLVAPVVIAAVGTLLTGTNHFDRLEKVSIDWRFDFRGPRKPRSDIVIVEIDEQSRRNLRQGDYRFNIREHLPDAIENLADANSLVVGIDVVFDALSTSSVDNRLAQAFAETDVVLAITHTDEKRNRAHDVFLDSEPSEGVVTVYPDNDGVLRRLPEYLYLDVLNTDRTISTIPHFPLTVAMYGLWEQDKNAEIQFTDDGATLGDRYIRKRELIDYTAPQGAGWKTLPFDSAVRNKFNQELVSGAIVLIGESRSITDQFPMPLAVGTDPGIYYHANVISQVLDNRFFNTNWTRRPSKPVLVFLISVGAGFFAWHQRKWWEYRYSTLTLFLYILASLVFFLGGWSYLAFYLFTKGTVVPLAAPLGAIGFSFGTGLTFQWIITTASSRRLMKRAQKIESLFGQSVSARVLDTLKKAPNDIMRTSVREVSVLFCDLRGFTATSSCLPPEKVAEFLNEYFNHITHAVFENDGFTDKFVGDEIMAVFSAPLEQEDHAERAVRTAIAMKIYLAELNEKRLVRGEPALECGIGIHCGPAACGHIGSSERSNYTVVGDTVNIAARIEGLTKGGEVLISKELKDRLPHDIKTCHWKEVEIRGSSRKYDLFMIDISKPAQSDKA